MTAVLLLVNSSAIVVPAWFWIVGVLASIAIGALAQWAVSLRAKREAARRVMALTIGAATTIAAVYILFDCGWMPDWLCFMVI